MGARGPGGPAVRAPAAGRPGRAALCVCCAMVLAASVHEAAAQEKEIVECPKDMPEGGWKDGDDTTRYCCKSIRWGNGAPCCTQNLCAARTPRPQTSRLLCARALTPRVPRPGWCTHKGCIGRGCSDNNGTKCPDLSGARSPPVGGTRVCAASPDRRRAAAIALCAVAASSRLHRCCACWSICALHSWLAVLPSLRCRQPSPLRRRAPLTCFDDLQSVCAMGYPTTLARHVWSWRRASR